MGVSVIALLHPNPGKTARAREILESLPAQVKANEPKVTVYDIQSTEDYIEGETSFLVYMNVEDESWLKERMQLPYHVKIQKEIKEENLLKEYKYLRLTRVAAI